MFYDFSQDSAQARLDLSTRMSHVEGNAPVYTRVTYVSERAAARFHDTCYGKIFATAEVDV